MGKDIAMLFAGMGISLLTTFVLWAISALFAFFYKLEVELRVMERTGCRVTIKFRFTNKTKTTKYVQNIKVYYDNANKRMFQCENQVITFDSFAVTMDTEYDTTFSVAVPPESIKEITLCFQDVEPIDVSKEYTIWYNAQKFMYKFDMKSNNWQKIHEKVK